MTDPANAQFLCGPTSDSACTPCSVKVVTALNPDTADFRALVMFERQFTKFESAEFADVGLAMEHLHKVLAQEVHEKLYEDDDQSYEVTSSDSIEAEMA